MMAKEQISHDDKKGNVHKQQKKEQGKHHDGGGGETGALISLQQKVGNQTVQRLLAQRSGQGPTELDDGTADRINRERGGGQALDGDVADQMGGAMGQDFSDVNVHTSRESDDLNQEIGSRAFTTGHDVFFRDGAYEPNTGSGKELIAHELTHVAQQGEGRVNSGGRMAVNEPGDAYEQEADSVSKTVTSGEAAAPVQAQEEEEVQQQEEEEVQQQEEEEVQQQEEEEEKTV